MFKPSIFGKLCLLERISVGGMAEVYRAKPFNAPEFDRLLAVKRILPNLAEDQEFIDMFVDEAKIVIQLNHPNICQIYELGKLGGGPYIVMEYIAGHNVLAIQKRVTRSRRILDVSVASYVARGIAAALDHAHAQLDTDGNPLEIVHRDVSPQNILLSYAGDVKLIDFGIAKVAKRQHETQAGVLKGKFSYMSPEQVSGRPIDNRSDLFALGIVFHEMLTGRRLFHGESDFSTMEIVRAANVKPPSATNPKVPSSLDKIVLKALARERNDRYSCGEELAEDLERFLKKYSPFFDQAHLSAWMVANFPEELANERRQREVYKQFITQDDVQAFNERWLDELKASLGAPLGDASGGVTRDTSVTKLHQADYDGLIAELEPRGLEVIDEEVLAENIIGPLPDLVVKPREDMFGSIELPEPIEPEQFKELFKPHKKRLHPLLLALLLIVPFGLLVAVLLPMLSDPEGTQGEGGGMLMIDVVPAEDLQVFVDNRLEDTRSPTVMRDIARGEHTVEVRHEGFFSETAIATVEIGRAAQLQFALQPKPRGSGRLTVMLDPPSAEVWVDGVQRGGEGAERGMTLTTPGQHLIEVRNTGFYVFDEQVRMAAGDELTIDVQLSPVTGTAFIHSDPPGEVYCDGELVGTTDSELTITDLDRSASHPLRIVPRGNGYQEWETVLLFDSAPVLDVYANLPRFDEPSRPADTEAGLFAVDTGTDWYRVLLDGHDTGRTTPITLEQPMALHVGTREVTLVRGQRRHSLRFLVELDILTAIDCASADWECGL